MQTLVVSWIVDAPGIGDPEFNPPIAGGRRIFKGVLRIVFLPQILILFLFIGILEDSGYLARAALIADRTMARFGLQGKSFIPLLSAYACAVPAIMATRTIENKRDRIATILIAPFMTCSARLPVYTLVIAAFIPDRAILGPFLGLGQRPCWVLYVLGFLACRVHGAAAQVHGSQEHPILVHAGDASVPLAYRALVGPRLIDRSRGFSSAAGTGDSGVVAIVLWVLAYLPPTRRH